MTDLVNPWPRRARQLGLGVAQWVSDSFDAGYDIPSHIVSDAREFIDYLDRSYPIDDQEGTEFSETAQAAFKTLEDIQ